MKIMIKCLTWFTNLLVIGEGKVYHHSVDFTRICDFTWRMSDCEELLRLTHWGIMGWFYGFSIYSPFTYLPMIFPSLSKSMMSQGILSAVPFLSNYLECGRLSEFLLFLFFFVKFLCL